jgi:hypothetical protein
VSLLKTVDRLSRAHLDEVVYQVQKLNPRATAQTVVSDLRHLEDEGLVRVDILVSLTEAGREQADG